MDVDQAAVEALHEVGTEDAHVARADDPVRGHGVDGIAERLFVGSAVAEGLRRVRPALSGPDPLQRGRIGTVGEHAHHLGRQAAGRDRIEDGLQVAATAGGQNGDTGGHATTALPGSLKLAMTSARSSTTSA